MNVRKLEARQEDDSAPEADSETDRGTARRQGPLRSLPEAAYLALQVTGFRVWLCSLRDGSLRQVSSAAAGGQSTHHLHPDDFRRVTAAYASARVERRSFELDCRIGDRHNFYYQSRCWFGSTLVIGGRVERLMLLERQGRPAEPEDLDADSSFEDQHDDVLAFIAHQLRSPITTIHGNAHLLRFSASRLTRQQRMQALEDLVDSTERLCRLLDDLMTLAGVSEIASKRGQIEAISLAQVAEAVVTRQQKIEPERVFRIAASSTLPQALGHAGYVDQIIDNLLANARKYSPVDRPIDIVLDADAKVVRVHVLDEGVGLAPDEATRIFMPFYRSAPAIGVADGTGVGLAVCKRLAQAQGGSITARPRSGGGSEFVLSLRRVRESPVASSWQEFTWGDRHDRLDGRIA